MLGRIVFGLAILGIVACAPPQEEDPASAHQTVDSPALGLTITDLPNDCTVVNDDGADLEISCGSATGRAGRLTFELWPEDRGTNLLEAANEQRAWFEAQPGGAYHGNRELVTPNGAAYTARGRWDDADGTAKEETRVLALHPDGRRVLVYRLQYLEGDDAKARVEQLLYIVGETTVRTPDSASPAG